MCFLLKPEAVVPVQPKYVRLRSGSSRGSAGTVCSGSLRSDSETVLASWRRYRAGVSRGHRCHPPALRRPGHAAVPRRPGLNAQGGSGGSGRGRALRARGRPHACRCGAQAVGGAARGHSDVPSPEAVSEGDCAAAHAQIQSF